MCFVVLNCQYMAETPVYTHYARSPQPTKRRVSVKHIVATDISEPTTPVNSSTRNIYSENWEMSQVIKRSISSNAISSIKKRNSITSMTGISRTLSQSSCYSTGSTKQKKVDKELFNEFYFYMSGQDHCNKANQAWEILSDETKDIFQAKVINKKTDLEAQELRDVDIIDVFGNTPTRSSFMQYKKNVGPYLRQNYPAMPEVVISKIIGDIYNNSLSDDDKHRIKRDAEYNYQSSTNSRLKHCRSSIEQVLNRFDEDPYLSQTQSWHILSKVDDDIEKLNELIKKLQLIQHSKDGDLHLELKSEKITKGKSVFNGLTKKTKKLVGKFKVKRRAKAADHLYRTPLN